MNTSLNTQTHFPECPGSFKHFSSFAFFTLLIMTCVLTLAPAELTAQELYVFSEPASNMPAKSVSAKYSGKFIKTTMHETRIEQRHTAELMFGLNKNWMVHGAATFSDMYSDQLRLESGRVYAKYRFFSKDDVHRHFRMAAFGEASHSRNDMMFDEISLEGDQSGIQAGLIATQLWNKLAVSSTLSMIQVTKKKPEHHPEDHPYQAFNYSLSAGLLVLPLEYTSYNQTNLNIYAELLGQQSLDQKKYFVDLAPAVQLIFNSTYKLNLGYRFQLNSNMLRMSSNSFHIAFETVFLNVLRRKTTQDNSLN
ncbi:MAG: hypothetical protein EOO04_30230 [Chitinophagaceae bacterium]|nr:MAG: hypothetical protein EOO04_30230 [Chitinophagaceae bacterium]